MPDRPTADDLIRVINERDTARAEADALRAEVAALKAAAKPDDPILLDGHACPACGVGVLEYDFDVLVCPDCEWREGVDHG